MLGTKPQDKRKDASASNSAPFDDVMDSATDLLNAFNHASLLFTLNLDLSSLCHLLTLLECNTCLNRSATLEGIGHVSAGQSLKKKLTKHLTTTRQHKPTNQTTTKQNTKHAFYGSKNSLFCKYRSG
jgi:hypothetical protein